MPTRTIERALESVDWNGNVRKFLDDADSSSLVTQSTMRLALWARQFEIADRDNPALPYVRQMQIDGHHITALLALALYRPAAASMRGMLESALYYSYFRTHPSELRTVARELSFYMRRTDLIEYHRCHTLNFAKTQEAFDLVNHLNTWYRQVSAILHGQIPGHWIKHAELASTSHDQRTTKLGVEAFVEGVDIVHQVFLCTVAQELWADFQTHTRKLLLKGLTSHAKSVLNLPII